MDGIQIEKLLVRWCEAMHDSITWPRNGWYRCRVCGRYYAVPWVQPAYRSYRARGGDDRVVEITQPEGRRQEATGPAVMNA